MWPLVEAACVCLDASPAFGAHTWGCFILVKSLFRDFQHFQPPGPLVLSLFPFNLGSHDAGG